MLEQVPPGYLGSSPRMRATLLQDEHHDHASRFIPAHAGNTPICISLISPSVGSSPRMRATLLPGFRVLALARFNPAHAGNTSGWKPGSGFSVHPRACGQHMPFCHPARLPAGSSPRMRATLMLPPSEPASGRFIPADAGHTRRLDGPHAHVTGSSPRMRATRLRNRHPGPPDRFIPAHAGNTLISARCGGRHPVHPRACGQHSSCKILIYPSLFKELLATSSDPPDQPQCHIV